MTTRNYHLAVFGSTLQASAREQIKEEADEYKSNMKLMHSLYLVVFSIIGMQKTPKAIEYPLHTVDEKAVVKIQHAIVVFLKKLFVMRMVRLKKKNGGSVLYVKVWQMKWILKQVVAAMH